MEQDARSMLIFNIIQGLKKFLISLQTLKGLAHSPLPLETCSYMSLL